MFGSWFSKKKSKAACEAVGAPSQTIEPDAMKPTNPQKKFMVGPYAITDKEGGAVLGSVSKCFVLIQAWAGLVQSRGIEAGMRSMMLPMKLPSIKIWTSCCPTIAIGFLKC